MSEVTNFLKACEAWDCVKVKEYLDKGVDVNVKDGGKFALKYAAGQRGLKDGRCISGIQLLEELLLCPNLAVNNTDSVGRTAFMWSCMYGSREVVERLLTVPGVDINHRDDLGYTAFMLACHSRSKEIVELLLGNPNVDTNGVNKSGRTAFMMTCKQGWKEIVERMMEHTEVDINHRDNGGKNALMMAWDGGYGFEDIVVMLVEAEGLDIIGNEKYIQKMLLSSCSQGREKVTRSLLALPNIDINIRDSSGQTPLMRSCWNMNYDNYKKKYSITKMLLDVHGIDPNVRGVVGFTAMMFAVHSPNSEEIIKLLVECDKIGINWNIKSNQGLDVFTMALEKGNVNTIKILLNIPSLKPDVELLRKKNVYEEAATHCRQYVSNKMISAGVSYSTDPFDVVNLYAFAFANGMKNIATVLIPDHDTAIEKCRLLVAEVMDNDQNLHPGVNMTELVYALRKRMENLSLVLASRVKTSDILLMCQIFHAEQEKLKKERLASKTQETKPIPRKRTKLN